MSMLGEKKHSQICKLSGCFIPALIIALFCVHHIIYHVMYHIISYVIYHVMSRHVMSCHVMSCHVMSCHVASCHHVVSCRVVSVSCRVGRHGPSVSPRRLLREEMEQRSKRAQRVLPHDKGSTRAQRALRTGSSPSRESKLN